MMAAASPSDPLRECDATIVMTIRNAHAAAIPRLNSEPRRKTNESASGTMATMFSARSFGF